MTKVSVVKAPQPGAFLLPAVIYFYTITGNQQTIPMMNIPDAPDGSSLWTLGAGALAGLMYLRRFLSRQAVDLKKDDAEGNLIQTLQAERDKAMEAAERAWASRAEDARLIGELTSEVRASRGVIEELKTQLGAVRRELDQVKQVMQGNGNGA